MTARLLSNLAAVVVAVSCAAAVRSVRAQEPDLGTEAQRAAGKQLYARNCAQCHGQNAQGGVKGRTWVPPGTTEPIPYEAPALNNVFVRYMVDAKTPLNATSAYNQVYETISRGRPGTPMPEQVM